MEENLLVEKIYLDIKNRIMSAEYLPGSHLVESSLAEELKVSRVTIRDALRRLVADELVISVPNRGITVRKLSHQDILELYTVREQLEGLAARLVVEGPVGDVNLLQGICSQGAGAVQERDFIKHRQLNNVFHRTLAVLTGNTVLIKTIERLNTQIIANQFMLFMQTKDIDRSQAAHEQLLEAIYAGNGEGAEMIMRRHIREGREFALSCFSGNQVTFQS